MIINIDFAKLSAPSIKFHIMCGYGGPKKGTRPGSRVIVAYDAEGNCWQHKKLFLENEGQKAVDLMKKIDNIGKIDTQYWRIADRKEY